MPSAEMRIVAMQPFIRFLSQDEEPFRWRDDAIDNQIAAIIRTLDIARNGFNGLSANITLFPEYSIPGFNGVEEIDNIINDETWPNETVIIAGIHGLTKPEYAAIWETLEAYPTVGHLPEDVPDNQWVNCCAIWVKDLEGEVRKWIQPKIRPSWPERNVMNNDMFCGSNVYIFESMFEPDGIPCRFFSLICFDWVSSHTGRTVCEEVLQKLNESWDPTQKFLHLVFVIQHNDKPNHISFLNKTNDFFIDPKEYPFVERNDAIIVHANTAASILPSRFGNGGFTACVFSPRALFGIDECRPTVCMQPENLRGSEILSQCKDVVFREMGECIHSFKVNVPKFIKLDATGKVLPLSSANVHPITETNDLRLSGGPVPASVKWLGDSLDNIELLSSTSLQNQPLSPIAEEVEPVIIDSIRNSSGQSANRLVNWASCCIDGDIEIRDPNHRKNADLWNQPEKNALEHIVHSLTSIGIAYKLDINNTDLHALVMDDERIVQIVAIRGDDFEDCVKHYNSYIRSSIMNSVVVIMRDRDNLKMVPGLLKSILDSDNDRGEIFKDYQSIITCCRESENSEVLKGKFDDIFPKFDRPII